MDNKVDKAFEKWFKERELDASDIEVESMGIGFEAGFKAGQEDRDKEVEDLKGQTNKALIMTTNYMTENRQLIKQLEKRQHLQSKLDRAVEILEQFCCEERMSGKRKCYNCIKRYACRYIQSMNGMGCINWK